VPVSDPLGPEAREWLGEPTDEIRAAVEEKRRFTIELDHWPKDEQASRAVAERLSPALRTFTEVQAALDVAEIPTAPGFLDVDAAMLRATFRHATRLRSRYTMLDLLEGQGMLEQAIETALMA
jgi:hypothetical protein